ncbi:crotonobetainyl-CoA:carnitine CoA-transferase CaiB-like acyl-CoA transferase [Amycolatopsis bartoniae]|uniref:CoA transferase n=1 Tax=Amycolatopsis bartoniae TaxID=941986 RepID=A0A8H9IPW3_9PSEU|nr:CaiB/BaiF CoA-transferase family protein [Amycolatopsis bartoniae]MBB2939740.1 crotonobetainyl-CoA:carnitine CoA-transferase CaiB-like acyl-CoA transferase [Amycolatopsis bartoniae]TVT08362.1 CoA transferase [Amycolatopsis bartoniae]GHF36135.1 CoA transferase [Amycolatopsis bartoniae]
MVDDDSRAYLPLAGVRVLDLAKLIPGDLATRVLADLGAEVVKVEMPGSGDYLRRIPPMDGDQSFHHLTLNRGKRSVALDLRRTEDRETFFRLADKADAIVEVSQPGRFLEMGVDFAEMRRRRPELVICSISGFGQTGPLATLPSHGYSMDALAGTAIVRRDPDRTHFADGGPVSSISGEGGANAAATATIAALFAARTTGRGAWIDISCWDAAAEMSRAAIAYRAARNAPRPNEMGEWSLYAIYRSSDDRDVVLCAIEQKFFEQFCRGLGREDLLERWSAAGGNAVDYGDLTLRDELDKIFRSATADEWLQRFIDWDVPGGIVQTPDDLAGAAHTEARGLIERNWRGTVPNVLSPIRWMDSGTRPGQSARPCSEVGADTAAVLDDWLGE